MDYIIGLNLINSSELVLIAVCVYAVTQAIKLSKIKIPNTYLPFVSMVVGIFFGVVIGLVFHEHEIDKFVLSGFLVGASTSGLFTGIKGVAGGYDNNSKLPDNDQKGEA